MGLNGKLYAIVSGKKYYGAISCLGHWLILETVDFRECSLYRYKERQHVISILEKHGLGKLSTVEYKIELQKFKNKLHAEYTARHRRKIATTTHRDR